MNQTLRNRLTMLRYFSKSKTLPRPLANKRFQLRNNFHQPPSGTCSWYYVDILTTCYESNTYTSKIPPSYGQTSKPALTINICYTYHKRDQTRPTSEYWTFQTSPPLTRSCTESHLSSECADKSSQRANWLRNLSQRFHPQRPFSRSNIRIWNTKVLKIHATHVLCREATPNHVTEYWI